MKLKKTTDSPVDAPASGALGQIELPEMPLPEEPRRPGRKSNAFRAAQAAEKTQSAKSIADELRDKLKAIFTGSAEKFFQLLALLGAEALTDSEKAIIAECVAINVDMVADDALDSVRRGARWVTIALVFALIVTKVFQILRKRRNKTE